jgi:hypothetical protein
MALAPEPTPLDRKVLACLSPITGSRASRIAQVLRESPEDVRLILRGAEHLGWAKCRGGWWRKA